LQAAVDGYCKFWVKRMRMQISKDKKPEKGLKSLTGGFFMMGN
jgi:hypothetical protein